MTDQQTGIDRAIAAASSQAGLADVLGVTQQAVSKWQAQGWAPLERAKQIAGAFPIPLRDLVAPHLKELME